MKLVIPRPVRRVMDNLISHGYAAYLVGGCVRDACLGLTPQDWDVTTSATPEEMTALFRHAHPLRFGTVLVVEEGLPVEVTTFRSESGYADHRHPCEVAFVTNLAEDLSRRDFTINALAADREGHITDLFNGLNDLEQGIIRAVGEPEKRFDEDALRMLRAVRFAARFDFCIEEHTLAAIREKAHLCRHLSGERIAQELNKLLTSPHPEQAGLLFELGLAEHLFGIALSPQAVKELLPLLDTLHRFDSDFSLRLGVLLTLTEYVTHQDLAHVLTRLRLSTAEQKTAASVMGAFTCPLTVKREDFADSLQKYDAKSIHASIKLKYLLYSLHGINTFKEAEASLSAFEIEEKRGGLRLSDLAVRGKDLQAFGLKGRQIGDMLRRLHRAVVEDPAMNCPEKLIAIAHDFMDNHN